MRDLPHAICAVVSLIADLGATFTLSTFVGGALVSIVSTDAGTTGGTAAIASVAGSFSFLLSLVAVGLRPMIGVVVVDLQREEEGNGVDTIVDAQIWPWTRKLMKCSSRHEHLREFRNDWIKVPECSSTIHESSTGIKLALAIQTLTGHGKHPVTLALMSTALEDLGCPRVPP